MDKTLLDTDIFSEILKGKNPRVAAQAVAYRKIFPHYTISAITVMEIVKGLHKIRREERLQQFMSSLSVVEVLPFDRDTAELAGRIYADLERTGQPLGRADPMIAAIAIQNNLTLTTGNTTHYQRIQSLGYALRLENWRT